MSIISVLVVLIIVGALLYVVQLVPMDATIKQIFRVLVIVAVLLWLLSWFLGTPSLLRPLR